MRAFRWTISRRGHMLTATSQIRAAPSVGGPVPRIATLYAFCAAAAGVALFLVLGIPLPWLLGSMFGCLAAALIGVPLAGLPVISVPVRTILGVAVGASITPAVLGQLGGWALSIVLVPPFIVVIGAVGYPYFRHLWRFDPATSFYGAMPGGLQDMLIFGEEAGGSARIMSLIHATRVLIVVSVLPPILALWLGLDLTGAPGVPARDLPLGELTLMVVLAIGGWKLAQAVGLFGATILGPLIVTAAASLLGVLHHRPPAEAIVVAQFFIGLAVGTHYSGITWSEVRRVVAAALGYCVLLAGLSAGFIAFAYGLGVAPLAEIILALSPGGQAEMALLAIVAGADVAYVVTHHIARIVIVIIGAPLVARWQR